MSEARSRKTLFDKVWDSHVVPAAASGDGLPAVLYIDLHLVHEVTSPQAFAELDRRGLKVRRPQQTLATMDHSTPTDPSIGAARLKTLDPQGAAQLEQLERNCTKHGVPLFAMGDRRRGIVHVIGPEQGLTQPGMTVVCGDSHTSTHGAFGALAFGIGTSEVGHVLATQCLLQYRPKTFEVRIDGELGPGVTAKDLILYVIATLGVDGGTGHVFEYRGSAIRSLDMDGRMTVCNMSIEGGARAGMIAPDETTFAYLEGRPRAPRGEAWERALESWRRLPTDDGARFDRSVAIDAADDPAHGHVRHQPRHGHPGARNGARRGATSPRRSAATFANALTYMDLDRRPAAARAQDRHGVRRQLHQLAHRRPARRGRGDARPAGRERRAHAGGARLVRGQAAGRGGAPRRRVPRRRSRVARGRLLDVPGDERRSARARPVRGLDLEPQLRRPTGPGRAHLPRQPADRGGIGGARRHQRRAGDAVRHR